MLFRFTWFLILERSWVISFGSFDRFLIHQIAFCLGKEMETVEEVVAIVVAVVSAEKQRYGRQR